MSELRYHDSDNGIEIEGESCPTCGSDRTTFDPVFGFWKCEDCLTVWGHDKDDPDYDEVDVCPTCNGAKPLDPEEDFTDCPTCGGTGYV